VSKFQAEAVLWVVVSRFAQALRKAVREDLLILPLARVCKVAR
jgi:hypothetical protein